MADNMQQRRSWLAKLACVALLTQIAFLIPAVTAVRPGAAPTTPSVRLEAINLTHTTQIYTAGCSPGTVNVTLGTQRTTPVPFYLFASSAKQAHQRDDDDGHQLPAVYFLNGFNVPGPYYSDLATALAASGFLVATSDYRRDTAFTQPGIDASCKPYVLPSAGTLNTLMDAQAAGSSATGGPEALLQRYRSHARRHGIILFTHSLGGGAGFDVLFPGRCNRFAYNTFADLCEQYYPMTRGTKGADLIRGTFSWEGYTGNGGSLLPAIDTLPADKFAVYIQGEFNTLVRAAANNTLGSSCVHWIKMKGNHYGLANINPANATGAPLPTDLVSQTPPCGRKATADPVGFTLARSLQRQIITDLAAIVTTMTRAILRLPGGGGRRQVARLLGASTTVLDSALNATCFS